MTSLYSVLIQHYQPTVSTHCINVLSQPIRASPSYSSTVMVCAHSHPIQYISSSIQCVCMHMSRFAYTRKANFALVPLVSTAPLRSSMKEA